MSDASKYFAHANALLAELQADAVVLLVVGGKLGNGCAPALVLDPRDLPEARKRNSRIVRLVAHALEAIAARIENDVASGGMPLEPKQ